MTTGCVSSGAAPRSDLPHVDACTLVSPADIRTTTGVDVAFGVHISSPLTGVNERACEWHGSGGTVSVSLQSLSDHDHASHLQDGILSDGTAVETDTYVVDTRTPGQAPVTAIGVWYRDPGTTHVVRCEVHHDGVATSSVDDAGALARRVVRALH